MNLPTGRQAQITPVLFVRIRPVFRIIDKVVKNYTVPTALSGSLSFRRTPNAQKGGRLMEQGKSKTLSIVLASGVGALLGALFALEINRRLGGGLGQFVVALIGASIGGPTSWALQDMQSLKGALSNGWKVSRLKPSERVRRGLMTWAIAQISALVVAFPPLVLSVRFEASGLLRTVISSCFSVALVMPIIIAVAENSSMYSPSESVYENQKARTFFWKLLLLGNLIVLPFTLLYGIYRAIRWLTPRAWRFIKMSYRYAHSSERRVSFFGGAIGIASHIHPLKDHHA